MGNIIKTSQKADADIITNERVAETAIPIYSIVELTEKNSEHYSIVRAGIEPRFLEHRSRYKHLTAVYVSLLTLVKILDGFH